MKKIYLILALLSLACPALKAQNIWLTQYENAPFMYNPAHANLDGQARLGLQYRSQPMFAGVNFQSFALSGAYAFWDKRRINKSKKDIKPALFNDYVRGGVSFTVLGEKQGNIFSTNGLFLSYNHIFAVGKARLSLSPQLAFLQNSVNFQNVITDNQISTGTLLANSSTNENFENYQKTYPSVGFGSLLYERDRAGKVRYFLGLSFLHLNRPVLSNVGNTDSRMHVLSSLQAGYSFSVGKSWTLLPHVRWLAEGKTQQGLIGLRSSYTWDAEKSLSLDLAYHTRQNATVGVGYAQKTIQARLTYDVPFATGLQREYIAQSGAWELSLAYKIQRKFKQPTKNDPIKDKEVAKAKAKAKADSLARQEATLALQKQEKEKAKADSVAKAEVALQVQAKEKAKADSVAQAKLKEIVKNKIEPTQDFANTAVEKIDSLDIFTDLDSDILYFGLGNNTLTSLSTQILERNFEILQKSPNLQVHLIGHTCNTGNTEKNVSLSQQRAEKVKAILVAKGINPTRIKAIGMGDKQPVLDHSTEKNRQQNRRVEILLVE